VKLSGESFGVFCGCDPQVSVNCGNVPVNIYEGPGPERPGTRPILLGYVASPPPLDLFLQFSLCRVLGHLRWGRHNCVIFRYFHYLMMTYVITLCLCGYFGTNWTIFNVCLCLSGQYLVNVVISSPQFASIRQGWGL
jgi:hypothetical protein